MNYEDMLSASRSMNETNDCAVKAVAVVTGLPYSDTHSRMARKGREARKGTPNAITRQVLSDLGLVATPIAVRSKTVRTLGREFKYRSGDYLVWTSGGRHLMAIKDGKVCDWTKGRLHRVYRVEKVMASPGALACNTQPGSNNEQL
jgi:hypothetical protein